MSKPEEGMGIGELPNIDPIDMALGRSTTPTEPPAGEAASQPEGGEPTPSQPSEPTTPAAPGTPSEPTTPAPAGIDPNELAKTVAGAVAETMAKKPDEPTKSMTREEADRILGKVSVSSEVVRKMFSADTSEEERAELFTTLLQQAAQYGRNMATVIAENKLQSFSREVNEIFINQVQPVLNKVTYEEATKAEEKFYNDYPGLAPYKSIVSTLTAAIGQSNPKLLELPADKFEKVIVDNVTDTIRKSIPNFDPKVKLDSVAQPASVQPKVGARAVPKATQRSLPSEGKITKVPPTGADATAKAFSIFGY